HRMSSTYLPKVADRVMRSEVAHRMLRAAPQPGLAELRLRRSVPSDPRTGEGRLHTVDLACRGIPVRSRHRAH
ncbi:MAG: hypothetical protein ACRDS9_24770, partial [Pseudonocardiaceae bacterium]